LIVIHYHLDFERDCIARCVAKGEEAVAASDYEGAIALYSAAIGLTGDSSLFAHRSRAKFSGALYAEAIIDAEKVWTITIMLPNNCSDCTDA